MSQPTSKSNRGRKKWKQSRNKQDTTNARKNSKNQHNTPKKRNDAKPKPRSRPHDAILKTQQFLEKANSAKNSNIHYLNPHWLKSWHSSCSLPDQDLISLVEFLAQLPASSELREPPIIECCSALQHLVSNTTSKDELPRARLVMNAVRRLLVFFWNEDYETVKNQLEGVIGALAGRLGPQCGISEIREFFQQEVVVFYEIIAARIKTKRIEPESELLGPSEKIVDWRNPTIEWLMQGENFLPQELPKCKTSGNRDNGIYNSVNDYFDTWKKLWIGITWHEGFNAITPSCRVAENNGFACGKSLYLLSRGTSAGCKSKNCKKPAMYGCSRKRHSFFYCASCYQKYQNLLLGKAGDFASTHIYDGTITSVNWQGRMSLNQLACRKIPKQGVHWNTTSRLAAPNLVGIIKLNSYGSDLKPSDRISWAEVSFTGKTTRPAKEREKGYLTVSLLPNLHPDPIDFNDGDHIAIIDCKTFVPEFIPVLCAIESQIAEGIPFEKGSLLNIGNHKTIPPQVIDKTLPIEQAIELCLQRSQLKPLKMLRENSISLHGLQESLTSLVTQTTLDSGQLISFLEALEHPVHCTQGPPGTGKSYLGVALTRALLIIRKVWLDECPTEGKPPILVLSYKNHAIDEFLLDISKHFRSFIRMGQPANSRLDCYAEKYLRRANFDLRKQEKKITNLMEKINKCQTVLDDSSILFCDRNALSLCHSNRLTFAVLLVSLSLTKLEIEGEFSVSSLQSMISQTEIHSLVKIASDMDSMKKDFHNYAHLVEKLYEGIKHYDGGISVAEILQKWASGFVPQPACQYEACRNIAESMPCVYCNIHRCQSQDEKIRCDQKISNHYTKFCVLHACKAKNCATIRFTDHDYCAKHVCLLCLKLQKKSGLAVTKHPRNLCVEHEFSLCNATTSNSQLCENIIIDNDNGYCAEHVRTTCKGITKKGNPCKAFVPRFDSYCKDHQSQASQVKVIHNENVIPTCNALTKKKKPCKGKPISANHRFCNNHLHLETKKFIANQSQISDPIPVPELPKQEIVAEKESEESKETTAEITEEHPDLVEEDDEIELEMYDCEEATGNFNDNYDELEMEEENEQLQHLRDVYDVEDNDDPLNLIGDEDNEVIEIQNDEISQTTYKLRSSTTWSWDLSLDERWEIIYEIINIEHLLLQGFIRKLRVQVKEQQLEYRDLDNKLKSKIYEGLPLIGGTIVGCIGRLEALRALHPFAIIVEEASEVLEPLLVSTFTPSTCKLEMIGDHLQLKPSMSQQFEFEIHNKMNISLFQRLITAPSAYQIPSSVLSVQRRMRKSICDFTRGYYHEITEIEDEKTCATKCIPCPQNVPVEGNGREIPGLLPHVYFWSHSGTMSRSSVGVSKENKLEADMVVRLAKYLVSCGCSKNSIAILTPYKGQMKLLQKLLLKEKLYNFDSRGGSSCVLSTVDRFQGDEADIVIVSLVIDEKSSTPFVKLENRMVVLLSRARLGMYVIGNLKFFKSNPPSHWKNTLELFEQAGENDSAPEALDHCRIYNDSQIGDAIPICCPVHRESSKMVTKAAGLELGFCEVVCEAPLQYCKHVCGLKCHWPSTTHNTRCSVPIMTPCPDHQIETQCSELTQNIFSLDKVLAKFKCQRNVSITLPCLHEVTLKCYEKNEFNSDLYMCKKKSAFDFIHPKCKHQISCSCYEYYRWEKYPECVRNCDTKLEYIPPCGHAKSVTCAEHAAYVAGSRIYRCSVPVKLSLPRCGHQTSLPCLTAVRLEEWQGESNPTSNIVSELRTYGPKESDCQKLVTFQPKCGHEAKKIKCSQAYEYAANGTYRCRVNQSTTNRYCGHPCEVLCKDKHLCNDAPDPVTEVFETNPSGPFNGKPLSQIRPCQHVVTYHRKCSHSEEILCKDVFNIRPCTVMVDITNPCCRHALQIPCHTKGDIMSWIPWTTEQKSSVPVQTLFQSGVLLSTSPIPTKTPRDLKCDQVITFTRACGHSTKLPCHKAFREVVKPTRCTTEDTFRLRCGHHATMLCSELDSYKCSELVAKQCWNFDLCKQELPIVCHKITAQILSCDSLVPWKCEKGHTLEIKQCQDGTPAFCPSCEIQRIADKIEAKGKYEIPANSLPEALKESLKEFPANHQTFKVSQDELLRRYHSWALEITNKFQIPVFVEKTVWCFFHLKNRKWNGKSASVLAGQSSVGHGVSLQLITQSNVEALTRTKNLTFPVPLVFGYAFVCHTLCNPTNTPKKQKAKNKWATKKRQTGYDSALVDQSLILWEPFCFCCTHNGSFSKQELIELANSLDDEEILATTLTNLSPKLNSFKKADSAPKTVPIEMEGVSVDCLLGTFAGDVLVSRNWNIQLFGCSGVFTPREESLLMLKLITRTNQSPYEAVKFLKQWETSPTLQESVKNELKLFRSLEFIRLKENEKAEKLLKKYVQQSKEAGQIAHPLLLLAVAALHAPHAPQRRLCMKSFEQLYPNAATEKWIQQIIQDCIPQTIQVEKHKKAFVPTVKEQWEELQREEGCHSASMDNLLSLVGLEKVKAQAVVMFRTALAFSQMSPEQQKKNQLSLNFTFLGNPGTGKTTVARLFADILHDSGIRKQRHFTECTAQEAKDKGAKDFRKMIRSSRGGVLFIDEAYELDPASDPKGKPIVSELLTAAENYRADLSIILAGYQTDINSKLYNYNEGLKSRFEDITFDDFSKQQLLTIWNHIIEERGWKADAKIGEVVVSRLVVRSGKRGFGNARDVRRKIESGIKAAMLRDYKPTEHRLLIEDFIGARISEDDPPIKEILDEFNEKVGWKSVKQAVNELIKVVQTNYDRELEGLPPLPIQLNRLFLGNPGTGKTTCAKLYGRLLKQMNILTDGDVVDKRASDFIGQHVGSSQVKTNDILREAEGKVLLIDEAYTLDDNMYGKQVLDILVEKIQGTPSDNIVVLMLGYEDKMLTMIRNQNPGLARRFPQEYAFQFEDYTSDELRKIFSSSCERKEIQCHWKVTEKAIRLLERQRSMANFGNAGAVESLLTAAIAQASKRLQTDPRADFHSFKLTVDDIVSPSDSEEDPFAPLDKLYNVENIRKNLEVLRNQIIVQQREGSGVPSAGHFVFRGSPGTGKTTVARTMARILYSLEVIATPNLVETSALNLTGEFLGKTKKVCETKLEEALGGILFIDEAYELGKGVYGTEAMTTILEAMTSEKHSKSVIILAGYSRELDDMLNRNPGMKSRFTKYFDFLDWKTGDCIQFLQYLAKEDGFVFDESCVDVDLLDRLISLPGWGNGRDISQLWKDAVQIRANRVVGNTTLIDRDIQQSDMQKALRQMINNRKLPDAPVLIPPIQNEENIRVDCGEIEADANIFDVLKAEETVQESPNEDEKNVDDIIRDDGVTDAQWNELLEADENRKKKLQDATREETKKILQTEQEIQEKIRQICPCPAGFTWLKVSGGWRCRAGGHFVSDDTLNNHFSF